MKGVYSDPSRVLVNAISKSLFPDTIYKNESGGSPDKIPDLSYKEFVDIYKNTILLLIAISTYQEI